MNVDLTPYRGKKICVALSGGRDSMALIHYLSAHAKEYAITLSALNCDHAVRGEESERDSAFVREYCAANCIPLTFFKAEKGALTSENAARIWRRECYKRAIEGGADLVATAHHLNDNAETVIFNLARGSALAGMTGITDKAWLIRPLIACSRKEIDEYVEENAIPFVTDSTNLSEDYTRNKLRHTVLPALEEAIPGATGAIYRFSRLAAEDEEYFAREVDKILVRRGEGYLVKPCSEPVIFRRAIRRILAAYGLKDFTAAQLKRVYEMQRLASGKRFEFLGLTAIKEEGGIAVIPATAKEEDCVELAAYLYGEREFCGREIIMRPGFGEEREGYKLLKFDLGKIPADAVVRFRREGDFFKKFGGGTKSLSDYFTDRKIPRSLRDSVPLICSGSEVLLVCGVEISENIKLTGSSKYVCTLSSPLPL